MFFSLAKSYLAILAIFLVVSILFCLFIPIYSSNYTFEKGNLDFITTVSSNSALIWPTPGYTTITSPYGKRNAPTSGASTFHSGIDIGAPAGTNIIAVSSGKVTFLGFNRCWWIYHYYIWQ